MHTIASRCVEECVRQRDVGVDGVGRLLVAYSYAMEHADRLPTEDDVVHLHDLVVGEYLDVVLDSRLGRPYAPAKHRYRHTPATFENGGSAADSKDIPSAMARIFEHLDADVEAAEFVRALLVIHPWSDGNGRTAFILYNWLGHTLTTPQPLPDFFG